MTEITLQLTWRQPRWTGLLIRAALFYARLGGRVDVERLAELVVRAGALRVVDVR